MSEIATDFTAEQGQPESSGSSDGSTDNSIQDMPEMGLGMLETDTDSDPIEASEQTDGGTQTKQPANDSGNQSNNDLSEFEKGRREADRYFQQKNEAFLAERRQFEEERRNYQQQQQPTQPQQGADLGDAETLRQRAMQVNDPEQQRALMEQAAGIEYVDKMVEDRLASTLEKMGLNNYQQDRQLFANMAEQQRSSRESELKDQIEEAKGIFGEESLKDELTLQFITNNRTLLSTVNPDTGKNFTLSELVGRWTGKPAQQAQQARDNQRTQRNAAKAGASNRGSTSAIRDSSGGPISQSQAIAEIASTM